MQVLSQPMFSLGLLFFLLLKAQSPFDAIGPSLNCFKSTELSFFTRTSSVFILLFRVQQPVLCEFLSTPAISSIAWQCIVHAGQVTSRRQAAAFVISHGWNSSGITWQGGSFRQHPIFFYLLLFGKFLVTGDFLDFDLLGFSLFLWLWQLSTDYTVNPTYYSKILTFSILN